MSLPVLLTPRRLCDLVIDDERSFRHVGLYEDLKATLVDYTFRVMTGSSQGRWDRASLLNLTFWGADQGGDVLIDEHLPADVVAHVAWHHLTAKAFSRDHGKKRPLSADALFFGEAIASAFDVYLVGRLVGHAPRSSFLQSQVQAMAESASSAGMAEADFDAMLTAVAAEPERAFEDLRQLLFDATTALVACDGVDDALACLTTLDSHRFAALLHHYEVSNWILYARAYAREALAPDVRVRAVDVQLRDAPVSLDWLASNWLAANWLASNWLASPA